MKILWLWALVGIASALTGPEDVTGSDASQLVHGLGAEDGPVTMFGAGAKTSVAEPQAPVVRAKERTLGDIAVRTLICLQRATRSASNVLIPRARWWPMVRGRLMRLA